MSGETSSGFNSFRSKALAIVLAGTALASCSSHKNEFVEGCEKFGVYAQNRWAPAGASVREDPSVLSTKLEPGFAPNEVIAVDGWVDTGEPTYPTNSAPWNSGVWYHLANRNGWVSFAAVRGESTSMDPTGLEDGGLPAPTTPVCKGTYQP